MNDMIWFKPYTIPEIKALVTTENILDHLGLEFTELGDEFLKARLPVDRRTYQINGILHGGATCVLAETVGSVASLLCLDLEKKYAVGSLIAANHLRPVQEGFVTALCKPVHIGRSKHVWDIPVYNDAGKLVSKCELTCAIVAA